MAILSDKQFIERFDEYFAALFTGNGIFDEAMKYACFGGGKRVRPLCVYLGAAAVTDDVPLDKVFSLAASLELVHSYSLVHDDLPAMDNDDYRRGRLTVHKKYGEANGILVGDALLTEALSLLIARVYKYGAAYRDAAWGIACAAADMVRGQVKDLSGCRTRDEYLDMYAQKTGALITAAFAAGAKAAEGSAEQVENAAYFGSMIGLAFQLADDLLDEGENNSVISVIGADEARRMLDDCTKKAVAAAEKLNNSERLIAFANALAARKK